MGVQTGANAPIVANLWRPTHLVDALEAVPSLGSHADRSARLLIIYVQLERRHACARRMLARCNLGSKGNSMGWLLALKSWTGAHPWLQSRLSLDKKISETSIKIMK